MANPWSPNNSDGMVILRLAENSLLQEDIADFVKAQASPTVTRFSQPNTLPTALDPEDHVVFDVQQQHS
ncbi:Cytochrome P450 family protein [Aspergillus niger]|uniref:Cytochrome P450 family protein n=1 Tax=Aspergillus niger TaxID=5061 RepID=A0A505IB40_ASPNG|nr:Cytochrome P450 family protein [Aspergillus niger]